MIPNRIIEYLQNAGVSYSRLPHPRAVSAQQLAASVHVSGYNVAKAVLCECDGKPFIAMIPAAEMLDETALARGLNCQGARLMTEQEFAQMFPDCELGAEPPFGGLYGLPVIADECLAEDGNLVLRAGSHEEAIRMSWAEFARLERPRVASIGMSAIAPPPRPGAFEPQELR